MAAPDPTFRRDVAAFADRGVEMAEDLTRQWPAAAPDSPLGDLPNHLATLPPGNWPKDDVDWLDQSVFGLLEIASSQLAAIAGLYDDTRPLRLHPVATLVRGIAEATGKIWWHCEPWIDTSGGAGYITQNELLSNYRAVLARSELSRLEGFFERRRRLRASHGESSPEYRQVESDLTAYKAMLQTLHGSDPTFSVSGKRNQWSIVNEKLPDLRDLVSAVTEYAYGAGFIGTGLNPYPLYSGYAHASVELLYAHATHRQPLPMMVLADDEDARLLAGVALRTFAVGYEIVAGSRGFETTALTQWETDFGSLINKPTRV